MVRGTLVLAASAIATIIAAELTARLVYGLQNGHREAAPATPGMALDAIA